MFKLHPRDRDLLMPTIRKVYAEGGVMDAEDVLKVTHALANAKVQAKLNDRIQLEVSRAVLKDARTGIRSTEPLELVSYYRDFNGPKDEPSTVEGNSYPLYKEYDVFTRDEQMKYYKELTGLLNDLGHEMPSSVSAIEFFSLKELVEAQYALDVLFLCNYNEITKVHRDYLK